MELFDDKQLVLDTLNSEAGRYLLGEKDNFPIFKYTDNSYHQIIEDNGETMICRAKMFPMKYVRYHFEPIFTKIQIANEYERIKDIDKAFLHYSNLKFSHSLPQIYLSSVTLNAHTTGTGWIFSYGTWANARAGNSGSYPIVTYSNNVSMQILAQESDVYYDGKGFMPIDTSSLSGTSSISSATIYLYITAEAHGRAYAICTVQSSQAGTSSLVGADWSTLGTSEGASRTSGNFTTSAYKSIPLNTTGLTWLSKTGYSMFGFREAYDLDNTTPTADTTCSVTAYTGANATSKPYIEVYYAAKSYLKNIRRTRIPGSITGL